VSNRGWPELGLVLALALPSAHLVQEAAGLLAVVGLVPAVALALWLGKRLVEPRVRAASPRRLGWAVALTFAALFVVFAIGYPIADGLRPTGGSDSDDALELAVGELLRGHYPYSPTTYLGNPISPLPGALLLAAPFVLLGSAALQNLAWLSALFAVASRELSSARSALLLIWTLLCVSPGVLHDVVTGIDYVANSIYVLLAMCWLIRTHEGRPPSPVWVALAAVSLGVALASRANFALILPIVAGSLAVRSGWRSSVGSIAIAIGMAIAITLPFYWMDPAGFSPLHTGNKLGRYTDILPGAGVLVTLANLLLACLLARPRWNRRLAGTLGHCAVVLVFPVLAGCILKSIDRGELDLSFAAYGDFALFFGVAAYWLHRRVGLAASGAV